MTDVPQGTFYVPLEIPSQNVRERRHWSVNRAERQRWETNFRSALMFKHATMADGPRKVTITSYRKRLITDDANLRGGAKSLVDALVRTGLIEDDNDRMAFISYKQDKAKNSPHKKPCTLIEIEEIP